MLVNSKMNITINAISTALLEHSDIQPEVSTLHRSKLADFVRAKAREKRLSYREISHRSSGRISPSMVGGIINERYGELSVRTLTALADGLGVTFEEVIFAAYQMNNEMTIEEQRAIEEDPQFLELMFIWRRIEPQFRPLLIEQAKLMAGWRYVSIELRPEGAVMTEIVAPQGL
jgi:transcriptional regulator with XRE-family HTH domain